MNTDLIKADKIKILCLVLSYPFAFAYVYRNFLDLTPFGEMIFLTILSVYAIVWLELAIYQQVLKGHIERSRRRTVETRIWEVAIVLLAMTTYKCMDSFLSLFFLHASIIYAVMCGTGHLFREGSSIYMPADMINGAFRIPFANFPGRIIAIIDSIRLRRAEAGSDADVSSGVKTKKLIKFMIGAGVVFFCFIFLVAAFENLADVDENFNSVRLSINDFFKNFRLDPNLVMDFILSFPVGMYLFGLFQGSVRTKPEFERRVEKRVSAGILRLKFIAQIIFAAILMVFIGVYIAFFISQASYMFSAFFGILPEEFTASEYAVSGFHELINVVIINFFLLALVRLFSKDSKLIKILSVILLAESMIFSMISASKILLYISRFGYTESRYLGLWGTMVVFAGSILLMVNLISRKKTFAYWLYFSVASYLGVCFAAFVAQMGR